MTIRREDIDAGLVDFSDIAGEGRIPLSIPGIILAKQYLKPLRLTSYRLAKDIKLPLNRITAILAGKRAITPDTALRLARYSRDDAGLLDEPAGTLRSRNHPSA